MQTYLVLLQIQAFSFNYPLVNTPIENFGYVFTTNFIFLFAGLDLDTRAKVFSGCGDSFGLKGECALYEVSCEPNNVNDILVMNHSFLYFRTHRAQKVISLGLYRNKTVISSITSRCYKECSIQNRSDAPIIIPNKNLK